MKYAEILQSGLCRAKVGIHRPYPTLFFFPGLNSKPLYPPTAFPHISQTLVENQLIILQEYLNSKHNANSDYKLHADEETLHSGDWNWSSYILKGKRISEFAVKYPKTVEVVESFVQPHLMTNVPFSYCFFSTLGKQASIAEHYGPCNLRVRCHFPLIVPSQNPELCGMKVGGEVVSWAAGEPLYFDDTYEHCGSKLLEILASSSFF